MMILFKITLVKRLKSTWPARRIVRAEEAKTPSINTSNLKQYIDDFNHDVIGSFGAACLTVLEAGKVGNVIGM